MPDIRITRKAKGGIDIGTIVPLDIKNETIKAILNEFKIINANILFRSKANEDQLIDVIEGNKRYIPAITVINKIDTATPELINKAKQKFPDGVFISADKNQNLNFLMDEIFNKLRFIRIFLK